LGENIFEALEVTVNHTSMTDEVMFAYLEGVNHCCQLKIMSGVILFMLP
jgi:hypothetical protein